MKEKKSLRLAIIGALLMFIPACGISFNTASGDKQDLAIEKTLQALRLTQTAAAAEDRQAQPEEVSSDGASGEAVEEPTETVDPDPCNDSHMVNETIADGTVFEPGETFTKSWTLRNEGTCDWSTNYKFLFEEGDRMGGAASMNLPSVIESGEEITFYVDLTAPHDEDDYTGVWRLQAADGEKLGKYWVKISVDKPEPLFAVTSVIYYMPHTTIDMGCPNDVNVKAEITANGEGTVTYKWQDSTGGSSSTKSVNFIEAGKKIVDYNVTLSATGDHWAKLYIDSPNHQWFGLKEFHVNCAP